MSTVKCKVLLFGVLADKANSSSIEIEAADSSQLLDHFRKLYPETSGIPVIVSVNRKVAQNAVSLNCGDEIALLPPFSGG
jgi:sulfur-carrier protein